MIKHNLVKIFFTTLFILVLFAGIASVLNYHIYSATWKQFGLLNGLSILLGTSFVFYSIFYTAMATKIFSFKYTIVYNGILGVLIGVVLFKNDPFTQFVLPIVLLFLFLSLQFIISSFLGLREHYKKNKTLLWTANQKHYFFKTFITTLIILIFSSGIAVIVRYNFDENVKLFWPFTLLIYSILTLTYTTIYSSILNHLSKFSFKYISIYNTILSLFLILSPVFFKKNYYEVNWIYYSWFLIFLIIQLFISYRFKNSLKN